MLSILSQDENKLISLKHLLLVMIEIPADIQDSAKQIVDNYRVDFASRYIEDALCMQGARIAVFEDHEHFLGAFIQTLTLGGHIVVGSASNMRDAEELIKNLKILEVQVVTVDGSLGSGRGNSDGFAIISEIKKRYPDIIIIGLGLNDLPTSHYDLTKLGIDEVIPLIDSL